MTYVQYVQYGMYMPDVKVYIREENLDRWREIANKSEWINTLLKNSDDTRDYGAARETPVGPVVTVLSEKLPDKLDKGINLCKVHGLPLTIFGKCLQKGCKYA